MRKILRELKRTFPDARIRTTGSNHYAITLRNGAVVIVASTPSCRKFMRIAIADVRRQSRQEALPNGQA